MEKLKRPVALIDGDVIAYRAASATDGRCYKVEWEATNGLHMVRSCKYKKEADVLLAELREEGYKGVKCTLEFHPEPLQNALKIVKDMMVSLETALSTHVDGLGPRQIYITRGGSFREALVPSYKQLRVDMRRPQHLEECKDYLLRVLGGKCMVGEYEADDLLAMAATEEPNSVICSVDKDLLQVPGHHFNFIKNEYQVVTEVEAHRNLYSQLLTGDTSDGIPGIHGIGPVGAKKLLKNHEHPFMMYVEVLRAYIRCTGKLEEESMEEYYVRCVKLVREHMSLLYLIRKPGHHWEVPRKDDHKDSV